MSVLIVDDELEILDLLKKAFDLAGIDSKTFLSSGDALEYHRTHLARVVLTDICMPEMDGVQLIRKIKEIHPTAIIFMMTGLTTMNSLVQCIEYGASDYFIKPLDLDFVTNSVKEALVRSQRWQKDLVKAVKAHS